MMSYLLRHVIQSLPALLSLLRLVVHIPLTQTVALIYTIQPKLAVLT